MICFNVICCFCVPVSPTGHNWQTQTNIDANNCIINQIRRKCRYIAYNRWLSVYKLMCRCGAFHWFSAWKIQKNNLTDNLEEKKLHPAVYDFGKSVLPASIMQSSHTSLSPHNVTPLSCNLCILSVSPSLQHTHTPRLHTYLMESGGPAWRMWAEF